MRFIQLIKKNKILFFVVFVYLVLAITRQDKAILSVQNSMYYVKEMLLIMPVVFILTSLIEAWVPKKIIINNFGEKSGLKGIILSLTLGSLSAGPIYAAFPFCKALFKKGARVSNLVIILSSWAVIKVPMLANEARFLGIKFMSIRWILTIIFILIMAYLMSKLVKKENMPYEEEILMGGGGLAVKEEYCLGCGLCTRLYPNLFIITEGKAKFIGRLTGESLQEEMGDVIEKCPVKAIYRIKEANI